MIAPSCIHLAAACEYLKESLVLCASQDISAHNASTGAYTGDCSAQQVADAGATWTILGHSERRQYHQESHTDLVQKLTHAYAQDLGVVLCIGETQAQYDAKQTLAVLDEQLAVLKELIDKADQPSILRSNFAEILAKRLIIAYEPVWAIGTGKVPTVAEVSATHQYIKQTVANFAAPLSTVSVLYGGSVNADNAASFAADSMIDGALVGGASLKAESFLAIADAFSHAKA
jgi:triosephosphate isomerase